MTPFASFDLPSVLTTPTGCICPHHGTDPCDCQMVVMLVYGTAPGLVQAIFEVLPVALLLACLTMVWNSQNH